MIELIRPKYGGKKGFLLAETHRLAGFLGRYRAFQPNDLSNVNRLVFVCKGNICRSPFADYYARDLGIVADSFGLSATTGSPANTIGLEIANELGVDMSAHKATHAQDFSIKKGDLLIGFEPFHCDELGTKVLNENVGQIALAGMWLKPRLPYIHDPYGNPKDYFKTCYQRIMHIVSNLAEKLPNTRENSL